MLSTIDDFCHQHTLLPHGSVVILGLSGGPDSIFLLHYLAPYHHRKEITLIAAHLDHQWRPESGKEAQFCHEITQKLHIRLITGKLSELSFPGKINTQSTTKYNGSIEDYGRRARRYFFNQIRDQIVSTGIFFDDQETNNTQNSEIIWSQAYLHNVSSPKTHKNNPPVIIALGHHHDDQIETFFIRLIRGSSLTGLTGMQPQTDHYIRPLLCVSKQEILTYLDQHTISYVIDSSNYSDIYLRNRIRMSVIPALNQCDSRFDANMTNTLARLLETEQFLEELTRTEFSKIIQENSCPDTINTQQNSPQNILNNSLDTHTRTSRYLLNITSLLTYHLIMQQRILLYWFEQEKVSLNPSQAILNEIIRFLKSPRGGTHHVTPTWKLIKKRKVLSLILS